MFGCDKFQFAKTDAATAPAFCRVLMMIMTAAALCMAVIFNIAFVVSIIGGLVVLFRLLGFQNQSDLQA